MKVLGSNQKTINAVRKSNRKKNMYNLTYHPPLTQGLICFGGLLGVWVFFWGGIWFDGVRPSKTPLKHVLNTA